MNDAFLPFFRQSSEARQNKEMSFNSQKPGVLREEI